VHILGTINTHVDTKTSASMHFERTKLCDPFKEMGCPKVQVPNAYMTGGH